MPQNIVRALGYTGARQVFTWPSNASFNNKITAHIWGGGGGGGGNDAQNVGGAGGGGSYSRIEFSCVPGDVIEVSVGSAGGGGASSRGGAPGGGPGLSLITGGAIFNSVNTGFDRQSNGAYCTFLNNYGVWNETTWFRRWWWGWYYDDYNYFWGWNSWDAVFDQSFTISVPETGPFTFEGSVDNYGYVYIDGNLVLTIPGFDRSYTATTTLTAGFHTVRMLGYNTGGPAAFALTINGGLAFSGGEGGTAGGAGSSGGGGGGGGATVVRKNSVVIGVAGGGGGGGGAGIQSGTEPGNAPGPNGQATIGINNGSDGGDRGGDGGGGGGGGGGWAGGNGGQQAPYDTWGYAGFFGGNLGNLSINPNGRTPGGSNNLYWTGGVGFGGGNGGGAGNPGYAVLEFEINGTFFNSEGTFYPVKETWVKDRDQWKVTRGVFMKINGEWKPVDGTLAPNFVQVAGAYGYSSRG
jgi:hypothetical protein